MVKATKRSYNDLTNDLINNLTNDLNIIPINMVKIVNANSFIKDKKNNYVDNKNTTKKDNLFFLMNKEVKDINYFEYDINLIHTVFDDIFSNIILTSYCNFLTPFLVFNIENNNDKIKYHVIELRLCIFQKKETDNMKLLENYNSKYLNKSLFLKIILIDRLAHTNLKSLLFNKIKNNLNNDDYNLLLKFIIKNNRRNGNFLNIIGKDLEEKFIENRLNDFDVLFLEKINCHKTLKFFLDNNSFLSRIKYLIRTSDEFRIKFIENYIDFIPRFKFKIKDFNELFIFKKKLFFSICDINLYNKLNDKFGNEFIDNNIFKFTNFLDQIDFNFFKNLLENRIKRRKEILNVRNEVGHFFVNGPSFDSSILTEEETNIFYDKFLKDKSENCYKISLIFKNNLLCINYKFNSKKFIFIRFKYEEYEYIVKNNFRYFLKYSLKYSYKKIIKLLEENNGFDDLFFIEHLKNIIIDKRFSSLIFDILKDITNSLLNFSTGINNSSNEYIYYFLKLFINYILNNEIFKNIIENEINRYKYNINDYYDEINLFLRFTLPLISNNSIPFLIKRNLVRSDIMHDIISDNNQIDLLRKNITSDLNDINNLLIKNLFFSIIFSPIITDNIINNLEKFKYLCSKNDFEELKNYIINYNNGNNLVRLCIDNGNITLPINNIKEEKNYKLSSDIVKKIIDYIIPYKYSIQKFKKKDINIKKNLILKNYLNPHIEMKNFINYLIKNRILINNKECINSLLKIIKSITPWCY